MMSVEKSSPEEWKDIESNSIKRLQLLAHPANLAKYLGYEVAWHHQSILDHMINYKKTLDLAPRGHGKSTVGTVIYCLWKVLINPNVRILIVSNTDRQAK
ncbi:MAG: hypothetical protein R6U44_12075, partial [Archaeoglobaceae archaeon]